MKHSFKSETVDEAYNAYVNFNRFSRSSKSVNWSTTKEISREFGEDQQRFWCKMAPVDFLRHGGQFLRVHVCRLELANEERSSNMNGGNQNKPVTQDTREESCSESDYEISSPSRDNLSEEPHYEIRDSSDEGLRSAILPPAPSKNPPRLNIAKLNKQQVLSFKKEFNTLQLF
uniref:uncharacterized protein LOC113475135 n=1 Tax=Ciona intestinalis TaxID=7719 RepID=UPI000EF4C203|nr:uncharacterized protein LOC113475135 [Ciona intestinalis]|eukprot:XP_026694605.1 uncharacterized protein LOC113475135 [Ciona intestinalis]